MYGTIATGIVMMILVGLAVSFIAQLILDIRLRKYESQFLEDMEEKLEMLSGHIDQQAQHLQESMEIIDREYSSMIKEAGETVKKPISFSGTIQDKRQAMKRENEK